MRISWGALLVLIGISIPFIVQARTVLVYFGYNLTVVQSLTFGAVVIGAIILWAMMPEKEAQS